MRLVDANVLLYSIDERSPRHEAARTWLEQQLTADDAVGFAWAALLAFVRVSTSSRVCHRLEPLMWSTAGSRNRARSSSIRAIGTLISCASCWLPSVLPATSSATRIWQR